eukprot:2851422-Heterocapsa_arctica.AAC.1
MGCQEGASSFGRLSPETRGAVMPAHVPLRESAHQECRGAGIPRNSLCLPTWAYMVVEMHKNGS